jgi:hypothetical protein
MDNETKRHLLDCFQHPLMPKTFDPAKKFCESIFPNFSDNLIVTDDIVYQHKDHFNNYKNKTLMLVGGGPSANQDWDSKQYDYLWSMNHFFLNEKLKDKKVDLAMILGEVNIGSKPFVDYVSKYQTFLGFEINTIWSGFRFPEYDKYFCMHTKFYSRLGVAARMLIFAAQLGFKKVFFTGLDGPEAMLKGHHGFQPGKTTTPASLSGLSKDQIIKVYEYQYEVFWNYIRHTYPEVVFTNVGGGERYHSKNL